MEDVFADSPIDGPEAGKGSARGETDAPSPSVEPPKRRRTAHLYAGCRTAFKLGRAAMDACRLRLKVAAAAGVEDGE